MIQHETEVKTSMRLKGVSGGAPEVNRKLV